MPRKTREFKKRSRAASKGWETRRKKNPQKWGRKALAQNRKLKKQLVKAQKEIQKLRKEKKRLAKKKALRLSKKERYQKKLLQRFEFLFTTDAYEVVFRTGDYDVAIEQARELNIHPATIYMQYAEKFNKSPREVYSNLLGSPKVA
jgi:hypothetical protein